MLSEQAERFPDRAAVICGERVASYRDLAESDATLGAIVRAERVRRSRIEDQSRPILDTFKKKEI